MAQPNAPFFDEAANAIRGCIALVLGRRDASAYFDFRQVGLLGSFIALLIGLGVQAFGPPLFGVSSASGLSTSVIIFAGIVVGVQFGIAWLVLRILGRGDGLVPFVVVQNWASMVQSILAVILLAVFGEPISVDTGTNMAELTAGSIPFLIMGILALIILVNIGRLILTLRPLHVAFFVVAQLMTALLVQPLLGAAI